MPRIVLVVIAALLVLPATAPAAKKKTRAKAAAAIASPVARYTMTPSSPIAGVTTVTFDGSTSTCSSCRKYVWQDDGPDGAGGTQWTLGTGKVLRFTFSGAGAKYVRLTVTDRFSRKASVVKTIKVIAAMLPAPPPPPAPAPPPPPAPAPPPPPAPAPPPPPAPAPPPPPAPAPPPPPAPAPPPPPAPAPPPSGIGQPSCVTGAVNATTAAAVRSAVSAGKDVCVTASVGNVNLDMLPSGTARNVGTTGAGAMGEISLNGSSKITFRARFRNIDIRSSNSITIEQSVIGGTSTNRVLDQLIFIPDRSDDVTIRDSDIGWTTADNSGNTGYGIRAYRNSARLRIERNYIHNLGADGIQLGMDGVDTLVDRNEIAYVAPPENSSEHSDDIQVVANGPNTRITNNYLHHNGWLTAAGPKTGGSGPYIHAGTSDSLLFENNLIRDELNFMSVGDLGTGGCVRSNLTFRRNTFINNGTMWPGAPDLNWRLCGGTNNVYERNVVNETFGNGYGFAAGGTTATANLHGVSYTIDADGACVVAACNPAGQEPIGYRKPSGVHW